MFACALDMNYDSTFTMMNSAFTKVIVVAMLNIHNDELSIHKIDSS